MEQAFTGDPTLDVVADAMVTELAPYLPPSVPPLPDSNLSIASMAERFVGIGRSRGGDSPGPVGSISRKGFRMDALLRFQIWGNDPASADQTGDALTASLLADRQHLRSVGFIRFAVETVSLAELVPDPVGAWRKYADYRVLYEFDYQSTNNSEGLIARIPVLVNGTLNQSIEVSDDMIRWDNHRAPKLVVRGTTDVRALTMAAYVPSPQPAGSVTLTRTFDGAGGAPVTYGTLSNFINAVSGTTPVERHARFTFPSFAKFRAAFAVAGDPIELGDLNGDGLGDPYESLALTFQQPVELPEVKDRFEITYGAARFNVLGATYLRAIP